MVEKMTALVWRGVSVSPDTDDWESRPRSGSADMTKPLRAGPGGRLACHCGVAHRGHACSSPGTLVCLTQEGLENEEQAWPASVSLLTCPSDTRSHSDIVHHVRAREL